MDLFTEVTARFQGGPWDGKSALTRFENAKPRVAVVVIDEVDDSEPVDITAPSKFTRHVYELTAENVPLVGRLTAEDAVDFAYVGPMQAGAGRLN